MAGIYVHIPFCKQACHYCNFHFSTSLQRKNELMAALLKEAALQSNYLDNADVHTLYFGGGTPSLLPAEDLQRIMESLHLHFSIPADAEITVEANPDDISAEILRDWKEAGVNRLSIGTQSFSDEDLKWMNRAHSALQAEKSILLAREAGFENLTIDLIYGIPGLTDDRWKLNVDKACSLGIQHLSCYALTVENKTALHSMIQQGKKAPVNNDDQARQFLLLMDWMEANGFEHYEISNFAQPGHRSLHNSSYWNGTPYLGLGPSAHSFNGKSRQWNLQNNSLYIQSLEKNRIPFEREETGPIHALNEYIMTSLRTMEGCSLEEIEKRFGKDKALEIMEFSLPWISNNKLVRKENNLVLTREGKLLADGISADLFFTATGS